MSGVTSSNLDRALGEIIKDNKKKGKSGASSGGKKPIRGRGSSKIGISNKRITKTTPEKRAIASRIGKKTGAAGSKSPARRTTRTTPTKKSANLARKTTYASTRARSLTKKAVQRQQGPKAQASLKSLRITIKNSVTAGRKKRGGSNSAAARKKMAAQSKVNIRNVNTIDSRQRQLQSRRDSRTQSSNQRRADQVAAARGISRSPANKSNNRGGNNQRISIPPLNNRQRNNNNGRRGSNSGNNNNGGGRRGSNGGNRNNGGGSGRTSDNISFGGKPFFSGGGGNNNGGGRRNSNGGNNNGGGRRNSNGGGNNNGGRRNSNDGRVVRNSRR